MKRVDPMIVEPTTLPGGLGMRTPEGHLFGHIRQAIKDVGFKPGDRAMIVPIEDTDFRPGRPSAAHVQAHQARGARWQMPGDENKCEGPL